MSKFLELWNKLDTHKTALGAGILAILLFAQQNGIHLPFAVDDVKTVGHDIVAASGAVITATGLVHKAVKGIVAIINSFKKA